MNFKKYDYAPIREEVQKIWDAEGGANIHVLADKSLDVYVNFVKSKIWPKVIVGGLVTLATAFPEGIARSSGAQGYANFFSILGNLSAIYAGWNAGDIFIMNYGTGKTRLTEQVILPHCREYIKNKLTGK